MDLSVAEQGQRDRDHPAAGGGPDLQIRDLRLAGLERALERLERGHARQRAPERAQEVQHLPARGIHEGHRQPPPIGLAREPRLLVEVPEVARVEIGGGREPLQPGQRGLDLAIHRHASGSGRDRAAPAPCCDARPRAPTRSRGRPTPSSGTRVRPTTARRNVRSFMPAAENRGKRAASASFLVAVARLCYAPDCHGRRATRPLRRHRHRRRDLRHVPAPPAARARPAGAGVRGRRRRRRHLVLEPLPGGALRFRELDLRLLLLATRSCASGSGASTSRPSRRRCATATSSPTSSTSGATSSSAAGSRPRSTTRPPTQWEIETEDGRRARARFLITAIGPLSTPTMPTIPGVESFRGEAYHTGRWPHEPVSFAGKRVGVIGTGATAVQAITEIAKTVGHLTVFQRTPNWCAPLHNSKIDAATQARIKATYPEIFARCRESFGCFIHDADPRKAHGGEPGGARGVLREALRASPASGSGWATSATCWSTRRPTPPSPSSCAGRSGRACGTRRWRRS